jgi:hypothetical protein
VLDDARNYIATTDEEFSVIVTDVTNLKYKRNPYLYTREYFELMRDALSADGVAAAWLPVGGLSFNDLRTLIATFDSVFPNTTAWYFTQFPTHFIILVGTPEPTLVNLEELKEKTADVERDLRGLSVDNVYELASMLLAPRVPAGGPARVFRWERPAACRARGAFRPVYRPLPRLRATLRAAAPQLDTGGCIRHSEQTGRASCFAGVVQGEPIGKRSHSHAVLYRCTARLPELSEDAIGNLAVALQTSASQSEPMSWLSV